jgi:hypothetical protein
MTNDHRGTTAPVDPEKLATVRRIIRKDLDSVGMIPTGVAIRMIAQDDPATGFALLIEAVYVRMFHDRDYDDIEAYLRGPMQVKDAMAAYVITSAVHVREVFRRHQGSGKAALAELMRDKGAEKAQMKLLITTCHAVGREFNIPLERTFAVEDEVAKRKPAAGPQTTGPGAAAKRISDDEAMARVRMLSQHLRKEIRVAQPSPIPADLLPVALLQANDGNGLEMAIFEAMLAHALARCIQRWDGRRIRRELIGRLQLNAETAGMVLDNLGVTVRLVRGIKHDRARIEAGIRSMIDDPELQAEKLRGIALAFAAMQRMEVAELPPYRARPWWMPW